jgi:Secreted repeat of unknown function
MLRINRQKAACTAALIAIAGFGAAGCGSAATSHQASSASGYPGAPGATSASQGSPASSPANSSRVAVKVAKTSLGAILVSGTGRTLYLWEADTSNKSTCNGACAAAWPPLTTQSQPKSGDGLPAAN